MFPTTKKILFSLLLLSLACYTSSAQNFMSAKGIESSFWTDPMDMAIDAQGNVYLVGTFMGTIDADPGPGNVSFTAPNNWVYSYIIKLDPNGDYVWGKNLGGVNPFGGITSRSITLDENGGVYLTGSFEQTVDFDPGVGSQNLTSNGMSDAFILKLDTSGTFQWAYNLGDIAADVAQKIVYRNGYLYINGTYRNTVDFDHGININTETSSGGSDFFLLKITTDGDYVWSLSRGNPTTNETSSTLNIDSDGNTFWMNYTDGIFYLFKIDDNSNEQWSKNAGGTSIAIDQNNDVFITGYFTTVFDFDPGPATLNITPTNNYGDIFIQKLDNDGNLIWVKHMGGPNYDHGQSIAFDNDGSIYLVGTFSETVDFDPGPNVYNLSQAGTQNNRDIFYLKLTGNGDLIWAHRIGDENTDIGKNVTLNGNGDLYVHGAFSGTPDFDPSNNVYNLTSGVNGTATFLLKLSSTVGLEEVAHNKPAVLLYPNPAGNSFTVSSPNVIHQVRVTDIMGKLVYAAQPATNMHKVVVDVAPGMYHVSVHTSDEVVVKKIVIK